MQAKRLTLRDFRNYSCADLEFGEGVNILQGDNAQGKTNILEAVYLFSMGKALRAKRDGELIRHGCETAEATLDFTDGERDLHGEICLYHNRRKAISVNDVPIRRNSELVGRFRVVYFGPEYLGLLRDGPKQRRKNMDILISQLRPRYFSVLSDAKKLTESKNALLKMDHPNLAMLDILNEKLVAVSAEILAFRSEYIQKIALFAGELQREISMGKEDLTLRYASCIGEVAGMEAEEIRTRLTARLEEARRREMDARESVIGPHREDIEYSINGREARLFASQGQQKTVVLAQKLAEVALMAEETGEKPVLLLDDIMSELDRKRQGFVLQHIRDMQILITCTDTEGFEMTGDTRLYTVEDGTCRLG